MDIWPFSKKPSTLNHYFGLFLKAENGIGMIIERQGENFVVKEVERFNYSDGWEHLTEDVDEVLFKLESRTKLHLEKCIVFVYSHLIDRNTKEIRTAYLPKLKSIFKNLELKPLGYIECYEAVASFLQEKDQTPSTVVLIELDSTDLSVFVYKGGKIVFSKTQSSTDDIVEDLTSVFLDMHGVLLPSRIILYNSKDLDEESTRILTHRWSEELFVQPPRVEIMKEEEILEGLVQIFQKQLAQETRELGGGDFIENEKKEVSGFVIGADVAAQGQRETIYEPRVSKKESPLISIMTFVARIGKQLRAGFAAFKKIHFPMPILATIGVVFILFGLFLNEYFFHKASITVFVPSEGLKKSIFLNERDVTIRVATDTAQFSESAATTGKRSVGDKAKGTASVYNFDDKEKTFSKGTLLTADGLHFSLDQDVKVASASEVIVSGNLVKQPGKTQTTVTATDIGEQGNLAKGKRFAIDDLSTTLYLAINDTAFTGGSKRDVKTVAKSDLDGLKSMILDKGKKQEEGRITQVIGADGRPIEDLTTVNIADMKYSKELGEESGQLNLSANVVTIFYFYRQGELIDYLSSLLRKNVSAGMTVDRKNVAYKIDKVEKKAGNITLALSVNAKAIKEIPQNALLGALVAKDEKTLKDDLKKNFDIQGYELKIQQPLWVFKHILPLFKKNISVHISSL